MTKTIIIKCRVTPEEDEQLKSQAKGLNFSKFIRSKLLDIPVVIEKTAVVSQKKQPMPKIPKHSYRRFAEPGALLKK